jgi:hypothetical protein
MPNKYVRYFELSDEDILNILSSKPLWNISTAESRHAMACESFDKIKTACQKVVNKYPVVIKYSADTVKKLTRFMDNPPTVQDIWELEEFVPILIKKIEEIGVAVAGNDVKIKKRFKI